MSDPEPSRLPAPNLGSVGMHPMSLPPLTLPPIKTDQLGLSPLGMSSYPSPGIHSSMASPHMSGNAPSPSNHLSSFNHGPDSPQQAYGSPQPQQLQHPTTAALLHKKRANPNQGAGPATLNALHQHLVSGRQNNSASHHQANNFVDPRQIKSVPGSPNPNSNPATPLSLPVMRHNSLDMVCSPSSSMGHSPASYSNKSSPCQSPMPNGHAGSSGVSVQADKNKSYSNFGVSQQQQSGAFPQSEHCMMMPPGRQPPPYQNQPIMSTVQNNRNNGYQIRKDSMPSTSSNIGPGFTDPNGVPYSAHESVPSSSGAADSHMQYNRGRTAGDNHQLSSNSVPAQHSSQAIVQHLPLRGATSSSMSAPSSSQSSMQCSSQAMIQHHPLPPVNQVQLPPNQFQQYYDPGPPGPSTMSQGHEVHFRQPHHQQMEPLQQNAVPAHGHLLQQRLMQAPGPSQPQTAPPPSNEQIGITSSQLTQQQIRQILAQRAINAQAQASGSAPSPALQQVLASRSMAQQQQQQQQQHLQQRMEPPPQMHASSLPPQQQQAGPSHYSGRDMAPGQHMQIQQQQHYMQMGRMPPPQGSSVQSFSQPIPHSNVQRPSSSLTATMQLAQLIDERQAPRSSNKEQYRLYKRKFKYLVFENECYQEELRNLQRKLLKLSRDKNFLLDRLMQFEKVSDSSDDDSDASQKTIDERPKTKKRARPSQRKRTTQSPHGSRGVAEGSISGSPSPCPSPAPGNLLAQMLVPSTSGIRTAGLSPSKNAQMAPPTAYKDDRKRMRPAQNNKTAKVKVDSSALPSTSQCPPPQPASVNRNPLPNFGPSGSGQSSSSSQSSRVNGIGQQQAPPTVAVSVPQTSSSFTSENVPSSLPSFSQFNGQIPSSSHGSVTVAAPPSTSSSTSDKMDVDGGLPANKTA